MKVDLVNKLNEARKRLWDVVDQLPDDKKLVGEWTKKEVLSHIAGWDEEGVLAIPQILKGEKFKTLSMSVKKYNIESVEKRKDKSLSEIAEEIKELRRKFIEEINKLPDKNLSEPVVDRFGKTPVNVLWVIDQLIHHDIDHTKQLAKKLQ